MEFKHVSVLLNEVIEKLNIKENGIYVDCTLGGAGHSINILKSLSNEGRLIGIDQDTAAIEASKIRLSKYENVEYVHDNFRNIKKILKDLNIDKVDGILMDLGVSSYQLDEEKRGFSYMHDAPLDMRMNLDSNFSAFNVVNDYSEEELYNVIKNYGEEQFAKRIAGFIAYRRSKSQIMTTMQLVEIIKAAIPAKYRRQGSHPAKKTFQAIRIEVNKELQYLDKTIEEAISCLNVEGRICIISFHSLEDRIVKRKFKGLENPCTCPPDFPQCVCGKKPVIKLISKKPILPSEEEIEGNARSRSAKLRVAEKL